MNLRLSTLLLAALGCANLAAAQTITLAPSNPKRWDSSVTIGWLGGNKEELAGEWNDWYDTLAASVDVSRYWTPHFKTEIGATITTNGDVYAQEQFTVPGQTFPAFVSREHEFDLRALNLSGAYQLFENTWVHPFIGAGVQLAWERQRVETPFPSAFTRVGPVPVPPLAQPPGELFHVQPFLSVGAKFYASEEAFIRSDLSASFDRHGATRVWWRVGVGFDF